MSRDPRSADAETLVRHGAAQARIALLVVVLLVVYASLYPFSGWVDVGVPAFAYLQAPWPQYWVRSEIAANVAAYAPLGVLLIWSLYPACRGLLAIALAVAACALLSAGLEALQTYLPHRIASNVDVAANAAGALLGALAGAATAAPLLRAGWTSRWRHGWFLPQARGALLLAALWVFAQIPRQAMLFGTGELHLLLGSWMQLPSDLLGDLWTPAPEQRVWAELLCTAAGVIGVSMLLLSVARPLRARGVLPLALVACALVVKAALQPLAVPGQEPLGWLTPGALVGGLAGLVLATLLAYFPRAWQRIIGILALCALLAVVNLFPSDQYFDLASAVAGTGWLHLESLAQGLAAIWPLAALWVLARRPVA